MKVEKNILVTRPIHQANDLCCQLEQQGWCAVRFPTVEIVAVDYKAVQAQIERIKHFHWLVFMSANAANFAIKANNGKIGSFKQSAIVAIGKATEKALQAMGLSVSLVPNAGFNTEGLLAMTEMRRVEGKSCLIIRGRGGRETLANELLERGAKVEYMEVYERKRPRSHNLVAIELLKQGRLHAVTITSGEALSNLLAMLNQDLHDKLRSVPLVVISHRIKKIAQRYKFKRITVADDPSDSAIIEAVKQTNYSVPLIVGFNSIQ